MLNNIIPTLRIGIEPTSLEKFNVRKNPSDSNGNYWSPNEQKPQQFENFDGHLIVVREQTPEYFARIYERLETNEIHIEEFGEDTEIVKSVLDAGMTACKIAKGDVKLRTELQVLAFKHESTHREQETRFGELSLRKRRFEVTQEIAKKYNAGVANEDDIIAYNQLLAQKVLQEANIEQQARVETLADHTIVSLPGLNYEGTPNMQARIEQLHLMAPFITELLRVTKTGNQAYEDLYDFLQLTRHVNDIESTTIFRVKDIEQILAQLQLFSKDPEITDKIISGKITKDQVHSSLVLGLIQVANDPEGFINEVTTPESRKKVDLHIIQMQNSTDNLLH